jgi:diguanylate cyclase (GGDEF)-like protein/PAS domain S-box-containing protein
VLGFEPDELLGDRAGALLDSWDRDRLQRAFTTIGRAPGAASDAIRVRARTRDGGQRWVELVATNVLHDPSVDGFVVNGRDVTPRVQRERRQAALLAVSRMALAPGPIAVFLEYAAQEVVDATAVTACRITVDLDGAPVEVRAVRGGDDVTEAHAMEIAVAVPGHTFGHVRLAGPARPAVDDLQLGETVAGIVSSALLRHRLEAEARHQALHDGLTGLPNRTLLHDRMDQAIAQTARTGRRVALLLLDLDGFKEINDTLGHPVGDDVLCVVGRELTGVVRASDTVARLGGDEFGVLLTALESADEATQRARDILDAVKRPVVIGDSRLAVDGSVGVAVYPDHADSPTELLRRADVAMYSAKALAAGVATYRDELDEDAELRSNLLADLGPAIDRNELALWYQPVVDLASGRPVGVETLVRWHHPELGVVMPADFVPVAERSSSIGRLTRFVIESAAEQVLAWSDRGHDLDLAVNISARTLHDEALLDPVLGCILGSGLAPTRLVLEITETAIMTNPQAAGKVLDRLAGLGVRISIDDFGTGYCSLAYLRDLPVHELKLDCSYVAELHLAGRRAAIAEAIIGLGGRLGLELVAEGIEDAHTLELLRTAGVRRGQGFLFSPPQPASVLDTWLDHVDPAAPRSA